MMFPIPAILALSAPSQQQQQLSLPELSLRWQFDWQTNALLNRWEWSLFRQRLSLQQGPAGAVRAEWRHQVRNNRAENNGGGGGRGVQVGRRRRVRSWLAAVECRFFPIS